MLDLLCDATVQLSMLFWAILLWMCCKDVQYVAFVSVFLSFIATWIYIQGMYVIIKCQFQFNKLSNVTTLNQRKESPEGTIKYICCILCLSAAEGFFPQVSCYKSSKTSWELIPMCVIDPIDLIVKGTDLLVLLSRLRIILLNK